MQDQRSSLHTKQPCIEGRMAPLGCLCAQDATVHPPSDANKSPYFTASMCAFLLELSFWGELAGSAHRLAVRMGIWGLVW